MRTTTALIYAFVLALPLTVRAQETILIPADLAASDQFGEAVAISGSYAIVGTSFNSERGLGAGAAYMFFDDPFMGWTEQIKLIGHDVTGNSRFGIAVAIDGDYAIVGAERHDGQVGAAYVFFNDPVDGWTEQIKLTPSDPSGADFFGTSVAISGTYAVVGSVLHNGQAGAAYVFERTGSTWTEQIKLTASDGTDNDRFGDGVAISGDDIVVTAPNAGEPFEITGGAYVFVREGGTWTERARLIPSDFLGGTSAAIDGDYIALGAPSEGEAPLANSGAAYIFERAGTTWTEQVKLKASDARTSGDFGFSVALDGEALLVGAFDNDGAGDGSGAAYVFENGPTGWTEQRILVASNGADGDDFGISVGLEEGRALVGDSHHSGTVALGGAAYVYEQITTSIEEPIGSTPSIRLSPAAPNPARGQTTVALTLTAPETVRLTVYDVLGREVMTLHDGLLPAGHHPLVTDGSRLPAGVYLVRATSRLAQTTQAFTLIR